MLILRVLQKEVFVVLWVFPSQTLKEIRQKVNLEEK